MKIPHHIDQMTMVYDITNYLREKINLTPEQAGLLRFCLEDNILMTIEIDDKVYRSSVAQVRDCGVQSCQTTRNHYWCYILLGTVLY